jgi:DNA-binding PadR family transcriptional regulator
VQTTDAQTLVLCALADGPQHGYAINVAIEQLTGRRLGGRRLGVGSLYGALARLEAKGLVEGLSEQGRQHPVRLTPAGREVLEHELRSMAHIAQAGLRNLGIGLT